MNELNANYNAFVDFARAQMAAGNEKAVARLGEQGSFTLGAGRVITAAKAGDANYDAAYKAFRSAAAKDANMAVRDLFMKSMVEIFGSESRIPDSVKAQMTNFGTSKPLTARRIIAISNAVTAYQTQLRESATASTAIRDMRTTLSGLASVKDVPQEFLDNARTVVDRETANITAARDKFLAGEIGERELLKSLRESLGAFRNLTDYHVMKPISDQNAELAASLKKTCEAAQKSIENVINARVDVLNKEAIAPFVAQVKENPASKDLPADWEALLLKNFAEVSVDKGIKCARQFAEKFCADPSAFKPTLNQLARIRAFAPTQGSAEMLAKALSDQAIYEAIKNPNAKVSIEDKIVLFEQNASLRELLTIGLDSKLSLQEIMSDISDRIKDAYAWGASKGTKDFKGFNSDGLHVQCLREVNGGSLTINGKQVADKPVALKSYVAEGYGDLKGKELAYAEEIMNRFDEQHLGMRRIVTLMTGMADGINGIFEAAFDGTSEKTKLLPQEKSRPYLGATTNSVILGGTKSKDGYDITVADNGDVTIKATKYVQNKVSQLQGVTCGADVNGRGCLIAETRFEVTVTIPNQADAELNGGMPKFTVTDFKQEQL